MKNIKTWTINETNEEWKNRIYEQTETIEYEICMSEKLQLAFMQIVICYLSILPHWFQEYANASGL